uniref:Uncharacterized protein n=1 Tax=Kalanchoe fedtschenkoi TaxID=63787 RepID=A0A7N0T417_KALFE
MTIGFFLDRVENLTASSFFFNDAFAPTAIFLFPCLSLSISSFHCFGFYIPATQPFDLNTFPVVLKSVAGLPPLRLGKQVHGVLLCNGFVADLANCYALISTYSKFQCLVVAHKVWNIM